LLSLAPLASRTTSLGFYLHATRRKPALAIFVARPFGKLDFTNENRIYQCILRIIEGVMS
jgi:hypothetical protein